MPRTLLFVPHFWRGEKLEDGYANGVVFNDIRCQKRTLGADTGTHNAEMEKTSRVMLHEHHRNHASPILVKGAAEQALMHA